MTVQVPSIEFAEAEALIGAAFHFSSRARWGSGLALVHLFLFCIFHPGGGGAGFTGVPAPTCRAPQDYPPSQTLLPTKSSPRGQGLEEASGLEAGEGAGPRERGSWGAEEKQLQSPAGE